VSATSDPVLRLIEALAQQDAEDYLREMARQEAAANDQAQNPGLPATDQAA
jgi:hypothetical protein